MKQIIVEKTNGNVFTMTVDDLGWAMIFKWLESDEKVEHYSVDNLE